MLRQSDIAGVVYTQRMTHEQESALPQIEALHGEVYFSTADWAPDLRVMTSDGQIVHVYADGTYDHE